MDRNGICKKDKVTKGRVHQFSMKVDGSGRKYWSCDKCGCVHILPDFTYRKKVIS